MQTNEAQLHQNKNILCSNNLFVTSIFRYNSVIRVTPLTLHQPAFTVNVIDRLLYSYITPNSTQWNNSHNRLPTMYIFLCNGILQEHYLPTLTAYTASIFLLALLNLPIDSGNNHQSLSRPIKSPPKHAHSSPYLRQLHLKL